MNIQAINNSQNISFESKIRRTNVLGYGVDRAISLGDKGFFNAIKHLANDGMSREIVIGGSNAAIDKKIMATAWMKVEHYTYTLNTKRERTPDLNSFQLMGENVIELIKKLASKTGKISKKALNEKGLTNELIYDCNEIYRNVLTQ